MRYLLLLLGLLVMAPHAMAQWNYAGDFPSQNPLPAPLTFNNPHGLAVDAEGKVWIQNYFAQTGDSVRVNPLPEVTTGCSTRTQNCRVTALHVFNPDGTPASFSPISIVTLPGGTADTLGGQVIINGSGQTVWDYNTGRGLASGPDGNVYASVGSTSSIYKFDYQTGAVLDFLQPSGLDNRGGTAPSIGPDGTLYITGVFQDPVQIYDSNLDYVGNVVDKDVGINRTLLALPDGNTVIVPNYSLDIATIYQREDEFSAFDSLTATFEGMSVESITIHPTSGNVWASAGSPNDPPSGRYQPHTWYEFAVADLLDLTNTKPTPLDSIVWNNPAAGRPRAIAFSPDGNTAYVGEYSSSSYAVQKFVQGMVAVEGDVATIGASLSQNRPNPFSASTEIAFTLDTAAHARLRVVDLTGREVALLVDRQLAAGDHAATFQASDLAAGVYLYMLEVEGQSVSRRMLHVR